MRQFWAFFVTGLLGTIAAGALLRDSHAEGKDAKQEENVAKVAEKAPEAGAASGAGQRTNRTPAEVATDKELSTSSLTNPVPTLAVAEKSISDHQKELDAKERILKDTAARVALEEERVRAKIDELQKLQDELKEQERKNANMSSEAFARLIKTIEAMQPKKAAAMISPMEDDLAVEILMTMKEKKVSAVLDVMDSNRAMMLASLIAKRRPASVATGGNEQGPPMERAPSPK